MKESWAYQEIVQEGIQQGRADEARKLVLRLGRMVLGEPDAAVVQSLQSIADTNILEEFADCIFDRRAESWTAL